MPEIREKVVILVATPSIPIKEKAFLREKYFPLSLNFCQDCYLVQVSKVVAADTLFRENYFFFSSAIGTLVTHFKDYAKDVYDQYLNSLPNPSILEIGCNDGVLLRPFAELGIKTIGIDPATNVVETIDIPGSIIYNNYFTEQLATEIITQHGKVDAVVSNFSFAHIDDMDDDCEFGLCQPFLLKNTILNMYCKRRQRTGDVKA